jgi:bifunctional DNA-binding transcriptional regulator/antitoxin component of YhaV-PrlF toxin-antitoxin module
MQTSSQVILHNQAIIPDSVLEALNLREGDEIVFEIDHAGVHLRKAPPVDVTYTEALQETLSEWNSEVDDEAYADL